MKSFVAQLVTVISIIVASAPPHVYAQGTTARNFDAEIRTALQSAKSAAGFEFLGTMSRLCLSR